MSSPTPTTEKKRLPLGVKSRLYDLLKPILPASFKGALEVGYRPTSALRETGWFRSREAGMPVDKAGEPLPWYTYSAIHFLERRVPPTARVFEYGMGNSTMWWSRRAQRVESCEHDASWVKRYESILPANVSVVNHPVESHDYVSAASRSAEPVDILVIDGRRRVACAREGLARLSPEAVVIWDNSERQYYEPGYRLLAEAGFHGRVDFHGMGPLNLDEWCTSIFYRPRNCLDL